MNNAIHHHLLLARRSLCYKNELREYHFKSDDYATKEVPASMNDDQVDGIVDTLVYFGE